METRKAKPGGLEKAPTRGREQGKGTFLVLLQMVRESEKGREESERHLGRMTFVCQPLTRPGRPGWSLSPGVSPSSPGAPLAPYGDFSFLVRGEVPFSAFTTPFSW